MLFDLLVLCFPCVAYGAVNPPLPPPSTPPSTPAINGIHYTIERRGGPFAPNRTANLTYLAEQLAAAESRFNYTSREVKGNKIVRVPKAKPPGDEAQGGLLGEIGRLGTWFATLKLGSPPQPIQLDLDMLTADFAIHTTTSRLGSRFEDFFSSSYVNTDQHPFPNCQGSKDITLLPTINTSIPLSFAHCKPSRQSLDTLLSSGSVLGLAPSDSLSQLQQPSFFKQLVDAKMIEHNVISLTLINGEEGVLSIGGTVAESMAIIDERIERFLGKEGTAAAAVEVSDPEQDAQDAVNGASNDLLAAGHDKIPAPAKRSAPEEALIPGKQGLDAGGSFVKTLLKRARHPKPLPFADKQKFPSWRDGWKWSPIEGAAGWWQILMRGIWADGVKIMKNQPCVIDINTPFILAPPLAAKSFYASISGSRRLPPPYSNFYAFPCNNPPFLHFEFGGWRFPVLRGMKSYDSSNGPNGKFSLGKLSDASGYCIGVVVETRMGVGDSSPVKHHSTKEDAIRGMGSFESGMLAGNGMRDVWILGEPVFRGVGIVFDMKTKEVGFRTY